jgi:hypothetical protein
MLSAATKNKKEAETELKKVLSKTGVKYTVSNVSTVIFFFVRFILQIPKATFCLKIYSMIFSESHHQ